jgi:hypothetical protein
MIEALTTIGLVLALIGGVAVALAYGAYSADNDP